VSILQRSQSAGPRPKAKKSVSFDLSSPQSLMLLDLLPKNVLEGPPLDVAPPQPPPSFFELAAMFAAGKLAPTLAVAVPTALMLADGPAVVDDQRSSQMAAPDAAGKLAPTLTAVPTAPNADSSSAAPPSGMRCHADTDEQKRLRTRRLIVRLRYQWAFAEGRLARQALLTAWRLRTFELRRQRRNRQLRVVHLRCIRAVSMTSTYFHGWARSAARHAPRRLRPAEAFVSRVTASLCGQLMRLVWGAWRAESRSRDIWMKAGSESRKRPRRALPSILLQRVLDDHIFSFLRMVLAAWKAFASESLAASRYSWFQARVSEQRSRKQCQLKAIGRWISCWEEHRFLRLLQVTMSRWEAHVAREREVIAQAELSAERERRECQSQRRPGGRFRTSACKE